MSVRFGPFTLDSDRRQLTHSERGELHLTPKAFDLLALLVAEAPRVVRKGELHERLWPGTFVSDATLVGLVKEIRRTLDDRDADAPLIRTAHGVGYAFAGELERVAPHHGGVSRWVVAGGRRIPLNDGHNSIGRDPASTVVLDVPGVSRAHARIVVGTTRRDARRSRQQERDEGGAEPGDDERRVARRRSHPDRSDPHRLSRVGVRYVD